MRTFGWIGLRESDLRIRLLRMVEDVAPGAGLANPIVMAALALR